MSGGGGNGFTYLFQSMYYLRSRITHGMILNHAYGVYSEIGNWTAEHIDSHLLVNVRAAMMMIQSFANQVDSTKDNAITLFTSGQYRAIETNLMAYSVSKEATICLCRGTAELLADKSIRVNCMNPGCNDTGYCFGEAYEDIAKRHPAGRWGTPDCKLQYLFPQNCKTFSSPQNAEFSVTTASTIQKHSGRKRGKMAMRVADGFHLISQKTAKIPGLCMRHAS